MKKIYQTHKKNWAVGLFLSSKFIHRIGKEYKTKLGAEKHLAKIGGK